VALAECSIKSKKGIGFEVKLNDPIRTDALLFGESQSRIILVAKEITPVKFWLWPER